MYRMAQKKKMLNIHNIFPYFTGAETKWYREEIETSEDELG